MSRHIEAIREAIIKGWAWPDSERGDKQSVHALVAGFRQTLDAGAALDDAMDTAIAAAAAPPQATARRMGRDETKPGETPSSSPTELDPMLRSAEEHAATLGDDGFAASAPVTDVDRHRDLTRIEDVAGSSAPAARIALKEAFAARDTAVIENDVKLPTPLAPEAVRAVLNELVEALAAAPA